MSLKLYSFYRSSCAWRVRICLALKGVKYEVVVTDLKNANKTEQFLQINPMGQIPALVIGDKCLGQSMAMMEYIEEKYPGHSLLPKDLFLRAKVREICELICSGIQPLQNQTALQRLNLEGDFMQAANCAISHGFVGLERALKESSGKYCVGNEVTMADACLIPQVANAHRFNVDLEPFPCIRRINEALLQHPAIIESHPNKQPDFPVDQA